MAGEMRVVARPSVTALVLAAIAWAWGCAPTPPDYSDLPVRKLEDVYPESVRIHVVSRGETLTRIAREYGVDIPSILKRNPGLDPDRIQVGQKVVIPTGAPK